MPASLNTREAEQHVAGVRDARVGEHALHVVLAERREVADGHRGHREQPAHERPRRRDRRRSSRPARREPAAKKRSRMAKPAALGPTERNAVTGGRRALVDVGRPHVERRGADLVAEAGQHADHARRTRPRARVPCWAESATTLRLISPRFERLREPEDPAHAVEHDPRGDAAEDDVLQRRFARLAVVDLEARHDERDDAHQLERQVDHEQVAAHRHHVETEGDRQEQQVKLARPSLRLGARIARCSGAEKSTTIAVTAAKRTRNRWANRSNAKSPPKSTRLGSWSAE